MVVVVVVMVVVVVKVAHLGIELAFTHLNSVIAAVFCYQSTGAVAHVLSLNLIQPLNLCFCSC